MGNVGSRARLPRKIEIPKAQDPQATAAGFPDIPGLPGEITAILGRGNFPSLSDDEHAKLDAFLSASSRQRTRFSELLTPEGKKKHERMTEAMNRLRTINEYNTTLRRTVAPPSAQAETASSATPTWPARPFDDGCQDTVPRDDITLAAIREVCPDWTGDEWNTPRLALPVELQVSPVIRSWSVLDIRRFFRLHRNELHEAAGGQAHTAVVVTQSFDYGNGGGGNLEVPWNPPDRNYIPGADAVRHVRKEPKDGPLPDLAKAESETKDPEIAVDTPVTLDEFMALCCTPLSKGLRCSRRLSLQSAAFRGVVRLPKCEGDWKRGQSKKYRPTALMKAWPEYREHLPSLPELKPLHHSS